MGLMITCKEATELINRREEGKISYLDKVKLFIHLLMCKFCSAYNKQLDLIIAGLQFVGLTMKLDDSVKDNIKNKIRE
jgi:hypothetical protein